MNSIFPSNKQALWLGRFQPPTNGHLIAVLAILACWERLTIGIVHHSNYSSKIDPKWNEYLDLTQNITKSVIRNPFRPEEIMNMWRAILETQGISHRVQLIYMPRMAYQPSFNSTYPVNKYDFVDIALTENDPETDRVRQNTFQKILNRPIEYIRSPLKIHVSEMRTQINNGLATWDKYIPLGGYEYFLNIDGPRRMKNSSLLSIGREIKLVSS